MSDPKEYTVSWICAISTEFTAAQAFLDEKHQAPDPLAPADNNGLLYLLPVEALWLPIRFSLLDWCHTG